MNRKQNKPQLLGASCARRPFNCKIAGTNLVKHYLPTMAVRSCARNASRELLQCPGLVKWPTKAFLGCLRWRLSYCDTPYEQSLLFSISLLGRRKGGSAWIASTLWSRRSPKFWTSQSCFLSSNRFFQCEHLFSDKTDGYNWARCTMKNQAYAY